MSNDKDGKKFEGTTVSAFSDISVEMSALVWDHMMGWCKAATSEVSGMMLVEYDPVEKVLRVPSIYLPKQECGPASTDIDDDALAELQMQLHKEKKNLKSLRGWWHTHYNFSTFWSSTDTGTIDKLMAGNDWFLSIVVNQAGDFKARLDISSPFPIVIDDMDINVIGQEEDLSKYKKDIAAQVTEKSYTHVGTGYGMGWEHTYGYEHGRYWTAGRGYHDGTPLHAKGKDGKVAPPTEYNGKWWQKFDPELWHGYKGKKSVDNPTNGATIVQGAGQSRADFLAELDADRKAQEAAYLTELSKIHGANDDPMMIRLDGGVDADTPPDWE